MRGGFSNPEQIIKSLNVPEGARIADFGSGSGYFTLLLAKATGAQGMVSAIDVLPSALEVVKTKAQDLGLNNVVAIRGNLEVAGGSQLADNSQDLVLLANILFQSRKKPDILQEARRVTKHGGILVMIDWLPNAVFGPKEEGWKFSIEEGKKLAQDASFIFEKELNVSVNHWGFIAKKS